MEHLDALSVIFFQRPAFAAPQKQVDDDRVLSSESQLAAYFFVSEDVLVHCIEHFACLVDSQLDDVAVIEFRSEGGAQVLETSAVCKKNSSC